MKKKKEYFACLLGLTLKDDGESGAYRVARAVILHARPFGVTLRVRACVMTTKSIRYEWIESIHPYTQIHVYTRARCRCGAAPTTGATLTYDELKAKEGRKGVFHLASTDFALGRVCALALEEGRRQRDRF